MMPAPSAAWARGDRKWVKQLLLGKGEIASESDKPTDDDQPVAAIATSSISIRPLPQNGSATRA
jgi:hypothetical protein